MSWSPLQENHRIRKKYSHIWKKKEKAFSSREMLMDKLVEENHMFAPSPKINNCVITIVENVHYFRKSKGFMWYAGIYKPSWCDMRSSIKIYDHFLKKFLGNVNWKTKSLVQKLKSNKMTKKGTCIPELDSRPWWVLYGKRQYSICHNHKLGFCYTSSSLLWYPDFQWKKENSIYTID